jgi:hypothetical protein
MSSQITNIINLEDYRVGGSKVFTGRDRGEMVRQKSNIDLIDGKYDKIEVIIPDNIYSINPSFLEELLVNVVLKNGKERFLAKYKFTSKGKYKIDKPLNEAIDRILREKTALG